MASRRLIQCLLACVVVTAVAAWGPAASAAEPDERPNILLVLTDDQRWDTLGVMPTVQRELVGRGVTFTEAVAVNPLCCPSRATILTGQYSHTTGVYSNLPPYGGSQWFDDDSTIATWLHEAGYRTGYVGKYLNGYGGSWAPPGLDRWFTPPGWDVWLRLRRRLPRLRGDGRRAARPRRHVDLGLLDGRLHATRPSRSSRSAGDEPFFLVYAPYAPHRPATPAPRHARHVHASLHAWRPPRLTRRTSPTSRPGCAAAIRSTWTRRRRPTRFRRGSSSRSSPSTRASRASSARSARRDASRTRWSCSLSDNGLLWGEHRLRSARARAFEESHPHPAHRPLRRARSHAPAHATTGSWGTSTSPPPSRRRAASRRRRVEGRSLLPLLGSPDTPSRRWRTRLCSSTCAGSRARARRFPTFCGLRGERWKYVAYATHEEELYDLADDPAELRNLARDPRFRAELDRARASVLELCRPTPPGFDLGWLRRAR